jgi:hypothetical protein
MFLLPLLQGEFFFAAARNVKLTAFFSRSSTYGLCITLKDLPSSFLLCDPLPIYTLIPCFLSQLLSVIDSQLPKLSTSPKVF